MARPLTITVLGWLALTIAGVGLIGAFYWAFTENGPGHIYPVSHTTPAGMYVLPGVLGAVLLRWPRAGVLALHLLFATLVVGAAVSAVHMAAFFREWDGGFGIAEYVALAAWAVIAAATLPFWNTTPWEVGVDRK